MVLPRDNAVVGQDVKLYLNFYSGGVYIDPHEVRQVLIYDTDGSTVLETLVPVREAAGVYYVVASGSGLDAAGVYYDDWYYTWLAGGSEVTHRNPFTVRSVETATEEQVFDDVVIARLRFDIGDTDE